MNIHGVRSAPDTLLGATPNSKTIYVEMEQDSWLPVLEIPTHDMVHRYLENETKAGVYAMRYHTRAFAIGLIKEWSNEEPIK
jgi:hypothetical protein|tara:strand:+ start:717 stop:962 length:246 start_codon:yes stop_codon:yes gene_type:complete